MTDHAMQSLETPQVADALDVELLHHVTDEALEAAGTPMIIAGGPSIQVCPPSQLRCPVDINTVK
jgi:hypothetical protein